MQHNNVVNKALTTVIKQGKEVEGNVCILKNT